MKKFSPYLIVGSIILIVVLVWISSQQKDDIELAGKIKVKFQLQWFDQAQFAGFYVAEFKKFYEEEGLDVEIIPGGYNTNPIQIVRMKEADIALVTGNKLVRAVAEGHELKAFGTVFNKSIACFMSKTLSNIKTPQDLIGKKVGVYRGYDTEDILLCMLNKNNIQSNQVDIVDAGAISAFITGEMDVFPSYIINEPIKMRQEGMDINVMTPESFGVQFYSDAFFATKEYYEKNKATIIKFLRASAKGWAYAEQHQQDAINIMYNTRTNLVPDEKSVHQKEMLSTACQYLRDGEKNQLFYMRLDRWSEMEKILFSSGILKTQGHIGNLCDFSIIEQVYE